MQGRLREFVRLVRELTTDDAFDRYVEHHATHHPDTPLLDRRAFYLLQQQRKWTGVNRCC